MPYGRTSIRKYLINFGYHWAFNSGFIYRPGELLWRSCMPADLDVDLD